MRILVQPETQHRARYLTEGSRGSVKDRTQQGFPTIKVTVSVMHKYFTTAGISWTGREASILKIFANVCV